MWLWVCDYGYGFDVMSLELCEWGYMVGVMLLMLCYWGYVIGVMRVCWRNYGYVVGGMWSWLCHMMICELKLWGGGIWLRLCYCGNVIEGIVVWWYVALPPHLTHNHQHISPPTQKNSSKIYDVCARNNACALCYLVVGRGPRCWIVKHMLFSHPVLT